MALKIGDDRSPRRGDIRCPGIKGVSASSRIYKCGENNHGGQPPDKRKPGKKAKRKDSSQGLRKILRALRKLGDQSGEKSLAGEIRSMFPHKISYQAPKAHEDACETLIIYLRRLHPMEEANGLSIGAILRQMRGNRAQVEDMFRSLLAADKFEDIEFRLLNIIPFLRKLEIPVDYDRLYWDLWYWHHPTRFVQFFWSLHYWGE